MTATHRPETAFDIAALERRLQVADEQGSEGASAHVELYFDEVLDGRAPLMLVQHIPKTAGTSFRKVVRDNLSESLHRMPILSLRHDETEGAPSRARFVAWYADFWKQLAPAERGALRCVAAHEANFLLPLADRPVTVLTMVREPVERVVSLSDFSNRRSTPARPRRRDGAYQEGGKRARRWPLEKVYAEAGGELPRDLEHGFRFAQFFNWQARTILEPHFDTLDLPFSLGPPPDADLWRERLFSITDRHYRMGISERLEDFARELASEHGWRHVISPQMKVNTQRRPTSALPEEVIAEIRAYNWLDIELYRRALAKAGYDPDEPLPPATPPPQARTRKRVVVKRLREAHPHLMGNRVTRAAMLRLPEGLLVRMSAPDPHVPDAAPPREPKQRVKGKGRKGQRRKAEDTHAGSGGGAPDGD